MSQATSGTRKTIGRMGFAARGIVYGLVGAIALAVAFGEERSSADQSGALASIADSDAGPIALILIAIGLAAYALYRGTEVVLGPVGERDDSKAAVERVASIFRTLVYGALCVTAIRLATGSGAGSSGARQQTSTVFDLPAGELLVGFGGIVLIGVAVYQVYRGASGSFMEELETQRMDQRQQRLAKITGTAGHIARAVVYALIGGFLVKAAVESQAREAKGIDSALQELAQQPYGPLLLGAVALGFIVLGVYSTLIETRFRRL